MSVEVVMPRLSDSMESGVVGRWLRADGESVTKGDPLVEVETDKSTVELEAEIGGVLVIRVLEGESVPPGAAIAEIVPAGEERSATTAARVPATPVARRLATAAGLSLAGLAPGSGPEGRIHRVDVERALGVRDESDADEVTVPGTVQRITAERLTAAKREIPHYYLTIEVDATAALAQAVKPIGLTEVITFCAARALRELPEVNASWSEGMIIRRAHVNVGIAVSLDDGSLLVPVIRDADRKTLRQLSDEFRELVARARARELRPEEMSGGTFTITNLGMFGVTHFQAIINPPESGILAVGGITQRPVVRDGALDEVPTLSLSLSADHRVYAGVAAARFLGEVKSRLESGDPDAWS